MNQNQKTCDNSSPLFGSMFLRKCKQRMGSILIKRLPVTRHVYNHLRSEFCASFVRWNFRLNPIDLVKRSKLRKMRGLSVNVGCGGSGKKNWVNFDLFMHKNITFRYDCRKRLPLSPASAKRIRCEHFLEHLDFEEEIPFFLKSCHESLEEDGTLRIVVPDAGKYLSLYVSGSKKDWMDMGWDLDHLPDGFQSRMDIINHVFRQCNEHAYAYDFETLELQLRKAGFDRIVKTAFGVSADEELCDDLTVHRPYSLYVDAIKTINS